jgi:hypothetical protein
MNNKKKGKMNSQEEGWSPFMGDNPNLARFKITHSKPPSPKATVVSRKESSSSSSSSSSSEKGTKRRRGPPSTNVLTCRDDIFNYWTSVLAQDPDDLLVDEQEDPGFVRCIPCSARRMRAMKIVLIQHVVTQRHVDLTKTHITFYRIHHQQVSDEEDPSSSDEIDPRAATDHYMKKLRQELHDISARAVGGPPQPPQPPPPSPSPMEIEPPRPPLAAGETFRQRLARIAEEETRKLIAKK